MGNSLEHDEVVFTVHGFESIVCRRNEGNREQQSNIVVSKFLSIKHLAGCNGAISSVYLHF